ncbi:putative E3 ubiquitin-protein ligase HERC4 isoform X1 [Histomonas meleagridis]|uniref:putative E3 ubiquitin-protein ligase HERC4 isoform X1 n=1 Tax=Histomonas meleagridis TaxID=135588 RepID=UPI00355A13BA|nr:putative E3 ubiquitin-protein ligase HERC4 isoform X1 [Histomonas meleagridis]KAH0797517.1 putative E3 ubiquitin-protein ligase HERC4 isoform X1 [Histomonas meleagridis]
MYENKNLPTKYELLSGETTRLVPVNPQTNFDQPDESKSISKVFVAMDRINSDASDTSPEVMELEKLDGRHIRAMSANAGGMFLVTDDNELLSNQTNITEDRYEKTNFHQYTLFELYDIISISSGADHTIACAMQGQEFQIFGFGSNSYGQLGLGNQYDYVQHFRPIKFNTQQRFVSSTCGSFFTLLLTDSSIVWGFGQNNHGQLGIPKTEIVWQPKQIDSLVGIPVCDLAAGSFHTLALTSTGLVLSSGSNYQGQLGNTTTNESSSFNIVESLSNVFIVKIVAHGCYSGAIDEFGTLYIWGGKFGSTPQAVTLNSYITQDEYFMDISLGNDGRFAALTSRNRLFISGYFSNDEQINTPIEIITTKTPIYQIISGGEYFVLLSSTTKEFPLTQLTYNNHRCILQQSNSKITLKTRLRPKLRILTLNLNKFQQYIKLPAVKLVMQIIFSSLGTLNTSFLIDNFNESIMVDQSGIDIQGVIESYKLISENYDLQLTITTTFNKLLVKLQENPPKIRKPSMMRFFMIALFHPSCIKFRESFDFWRNLIQLIENMNAYSILAQWLSVLNVNELKYILQTLKDFLTVQATETKRLYLPIMAKVIKAIEIVWFASTRTKKLSFENFYHDTINQMIDINVDYQIWSSSEDNWCYARFAPWLLNADTKTKFLRINSRQLMNQLQINAMRNATRYWGTTPVVTPNDLFLIIEVDRNNILLDTFKAIAYLKNPDLELKKPLKILFKDEPGVDEGGVQREFFQLIVEELFDPNRDFFIVLNDLYWFSNTEKDPASLQAYYLTGIILGLAIYNGNVLNVKFPILIYRKLKGLTMNFNDLRELDPQLFNSLQNILNYKGDVKEDMDLTFDYGGVPLIENGLEIPVTNQNREEYVNAVLNYVLNDSISEQFEILKNGFIQSAGDIVLELFRPEELALLIAGREELDFIALQKATRYEGYTAQSETVQTFWKIVHMRLTDSEKKKLLYFVTSSPRAPINGLGSIPFVIARDGNSEHIPTSHTCFFMLVLPDDPNEESLYRKLKIAIDNAEGFAFK